jgi:Flp pilus assembly protein protease CpaA
MFNGQFGDAPAITLAGAFLFRIGSGRPSMSARAIPQIRNHILPPGWGACTVTALAAAISLVWTVCCEMGLSPFTCGILVPMLTWASLHDVATRRIPNRLTYGMTLFALSLAAATTIAGSNDIEVAAGLMGLPEALAGFAATFGIMLLIYTLFGTGAGDVKLAGAIGALIGVKAGLHMLLWTHLMAGIAMACFVVWRVGPVWIARTVLSRLLPDRVLMPSTDHSATLRYPVPMAVYFSIGTLMALLEVPLP